jgi:hypothetical protein
MLFFNKSEEAVLSGKKIFLAFVAVAALLAGTVMMALPGIKEAGNILQKARKNPRLIVIRPDDCKDCFDINQVTDFLKGVLGVQYKSVQELKASSAGALINQYKIEKLPTFILEGDIKALDIGKIFDAASIQTQTDKVFVYKNNFPPYYNTANQKIEGRFELIYLTDAACKECYDVKLHELALANLVMTPSASSTIDIASTEGKKLVADYKITSAPTILLQGDMAAYQNFAQLWTTVGSVEKDGSYIFREIGLELMGKYQNIKTGKVITPKPPAADPTQQVPTQ